ncbi:MAG: DUF4157 domain-containing protein [Flexilinea sp.]|nr:DUF4157 domain-containing protein [Flexilinea sp.]
MSFTYEQRKKSAGKKNGAEPSVSSGIESSLPNSAMVNELGHQVDMPVVMREKMEGAFGMDLSAVKLYENRAVGEAGAEAVAKGSNIAFAPGKLDFSSTRGQALLGHEISHVASQARGEVKGKGLVNDSALEARADREGLQAARGESVATAPLSNASAASAAGPMQAKSGKKKSAKAQAMDRWKEEESLSSLYSTREADEDELMDRENNLARLYRIQAAMMREGTADNPHNPLLKEGDYDFYKYMQQNADMKTFAGIQNRMVNSAQSLVNFRDSMDGTELEFENFHGDEKKKLLKSKKNYYAAHSEEGMDYDIYTSLMNSMSNSKGGRQKTAQDAKDKLNKNGPDVIDQMLMEANSIQNARQLNGGDDASYLSLYNSLDNVSKRSVAKRDETRLKRFDEIAMGGGKKKEEPEEDKQLQKDLDRLYAINAGISYAGNTKGFGIDPEDENWFKKTLNDKTRLKDIIKGINKRIASIKMDVGKKWEEAGGKNLDPKKSYELTNQAATDVELYQSLNQHMDEDGLMDPNELRNAWNDFETEQSVNDRVAVEKGTMAINHSNRYASSERIKDPNVIDINDMQIFQGEKEKLKKIYEQYRKKRKK